MQRRKTFSTRNRWDPSALGPLAWWVADPRQIVLLDDGGTPDVTIWRNRIGGNSGVLTNTDEETTPVWISNWRGVGPALQFIDIDAMQLNANNDATVTTALSGSDTPFSILITAQARERTAGDFAQGLVSWTEFLGNSVSRFEIESNGLLQYTRTDTGGTSNDAAGNIEVGTALRRLGCVFEGTVVKTYVDSELDLNTTSNVGSLTLNRLRIGFYTGSGTGPDLYLFELVVVPRAIGRNEWLHYYEYSTARWGPIASPTYVSAGTGSANAGGSITPAYPDDGAGGPLPAGALLVLHVGIRNAVTNPTTPTGWTLIYGPDDGGSNGRSLVYVRNTRSTGSDSGTLTVTIGAGNNLNMGRIYAFNGVNLVLDEAQVAEGAATSVVDGGLLNGPTISCKGRGRLAVAFAFVDVDDPTGGSITGETGGNWSQAAIFETTLGGNGTISLQIAPMPQGGVLSGGTGAFGGGSDDGVCRGFALVGE